MHLLLFKINQVCKDITEEDELNILDKYVQQGKISCVLFSGNYKTSFCSHEIN
jgi:hypothetical protein